jgi:hypothetical protein
VDSVTDVTMILLVGGRNVHPSGNAQRNPHAPRARLLVTRQSVRPTRPTNERLKLREWARRGRCRLLARRGPAEEASLRRVARRAARDRRGAAGAQNAESGTACARLLDSAGTRARRERRTARILARGRDMSGAKGPSRRDGHGEGGEAASSTRGRRASAPRRIRAASSVPVRSLSGARRRATAGERPRRAARRGPA